VWFLHKRLIESKTYRQDFEKYAALNVTMKIQFVILNAAQIIRLHFFLPVEDSSLAHSGL